MAQTAGFGVPTTKAIQAVLAPVTQRASILCTDGGSHFKRYCKTRGLDHRPIRGGKRTVGSLYHSQNVNAYHGRLKIWITRFKGVSTKYLPNYMVWYVFLDKSGKMSPTASRKQLLLESCSASSRLETQMQH